MTYQAPTAPGERFYKNLSGDPIYAITSTLTENLGTGNQQLARTDYERLVRTIQQRGRQGKDIRYAAKICG